MPRHHSTFRKYFSHLYLRPGVVYFSPENITSAKWLGIINLPDVGFALLHCKIHQFPQTRLLGDMRPLSLETPLKLESRRSELKPAGLFLEAWTHNNNLKWKMKEQQENSNRVIGDAFFFQIDKSFHTEQEALWQTTDLCPELLNYIVNFQLIYI